VRNILVNRRTTLIATPGQALEITLGYTPTAPRAPTSSSSASPAGLRLPRRSGRAPWRAHQRLGRARRTTSAGAYEIRWALLGAADCAAATTTFTGATTTLTLGFLVQ
jgi:hypothetical protein